MYTTREKNVKGDTHTHTQKACFFHTYGGWLLLQRASFLKNVAQELL